MARFSEELKTPKRQDISKLSDLYVASQIHPFANFLFSINWKTFILNFQIVISCGPISTCMRHMYVSSITPTSLINEHTRLFFKRNKLHPTRWLSCNRLKIPSYPFINLVLAGRVNFPSYPSFIREVKVLEKSLMHRSILFLINNFYFRICYVNVQWARCGWFIEHHERCSSLQKEQKCRYSTFGFTNLPQTAWWVVPNLKYRLNFLVKS